jgi:hypothetical protein
MSKNTKQHLPKTPSKPKALEQAWGLTKKSFNNGGARLMSIALIAKQSGVGVATISRMFSKLKALKSLGKPIPKTWVKTVSKPVSGAKPPKPTPAPPENAIVTLEASEAQEGIPMPVGRFTCLDWLINILIRIQYPHTPTQSKEQ